MGDLDRKLKVLALLGLVGLAPLAVAAPPTPSEDAAALLSRYPAGAVPVEPATMTALFDLAEHGAREDVSLLRNLAENERAEVRTAAVTAIARIRDRQRAEQREGFARSLPDHTDLTTVGEVDDVGAGPLQAACVAYARQVLGDHPLVRPSARRGDAEDLLAVGRPRKALAALVEDPRRSARRLEARAWEDLGETRHAVQQYALLAARGDEGARAELDRFGIDAERLLLGMFVQPDPHLTPGSEGELLEVLVREGGHATVSVLAEMSAHAEASDRATATDALVRMLDASVRAEPLGDGGQEEARRALLRASRDRVESIRGIAMEAL